MPQALEQKVFQYALKLGSYGLTKISHIFPVEHNPSCQLQLFRIYIGL